MTDYSQLVKRLRGLVIIDEVRSDNPLGREAADAIEALQARVEALEAGHRYIAKQWPDSFAARHARALLERKA